LGRENGKKLNFGSAWRFSQRLAGFALISDPIGAIFLQTDEGITLRKLCAVEL